MSDWLIVGLGNPGDKYLKTRHNIGWRLIDALAQDLSTSLSMKSDQHTFLGQARVEGERIFLSKPTTFMNLSGQAVQAVSAFYKIPLSNVLVVCDDVHLEFGRARLRLKGSSGGQNGIQSIIKSMGSDRFARLKIGVGPFIQGRDMAGFVLNDFPKEQQPALPEVLDAMVRGVKLFVKQGPEAAVQHCNSYRLPVVK